nr:MAG TPA: hypothetical protein [Caudoviricetes sp.]
MLVPLLNIQLAGVKVSNELVHLSKRLMMRVTDNLLIQIIYGVSNLIKRLDSGATCFLQSPRAWALVLQSLTRHISASSNIS